jgi:2-oxoisovalerate dehydrogenase E1 component beta subunit
MREINSITAINECLKQLMAEDERVILLGEDVGQYGGVFGASQGLYETFGADRVVDTPLAESSIAGVAVGAALAGLLPIAEIQFADFVHAAVDQIINEAAKIRYRSNNDFSCPLVFRIPYGAGISGGPYHSQSVEALFFSTPGLKIVAPATPKDYKGLLKSAVYDPDPVLFLEHKNGLVLREYKQDVSLESFSLPLGRAEIRKEGRDVTVITYGLCLLYAMAAALELADEGIDAEVLDLRTLKPLDKESIIRSVEKTGKVLIVHEDNLTGGIGSEIAAIIAQEAFWHLDAPVMRLAAPDVPAMPYASTLESFVMIDKDKIKGAIQRLAAY